MIVRVPEKDRDSYLIVSDELLANPTVSVEALGLYCFLISREYDRTIISQQIADTFNGVSGKKVSQGRILSSLKELEKAGYVERKQLGSSDALTTILYESCTQNVSDDQARDSGLSIFRLNKDDRDTYTVIDKGVFKDPEITLRSMGMLCYCLSNRDDWNIRTGDLINTLKKKGKRNMGRAAINAMINELIENGYMEKVATGKGPINLNQDYVAYESNDPKYSLTELDKDIIKHVDLSG